MSLPKPYYQSDKATLYCGDCLDILPHLSGVDAVVTDPPYPKEYEHLWEPIGSLSAAALKPGGHFLTLLGHYQLPHVLNALSKSLRYRWLCILRNAGGITPIMHGFGVKVNFKPALWMTNGPAREHEIMDDDLFRAGHQWAKNLHEWNQPVIFGPIVKLIREGETVCDPFMGSGTTGVAAIQTQRRFIGIEIDEKHAATAKRRIMEAEDAYTLFEPPVKRETRELFA